nr:histidine phosphatase family protein [Defluviimonas sediminis]
MTHPEVVIDPAVPVPDWGLSDRGRARVAALAARGWPEGTGRIVASTERKARETAELLAAPLGLEVELRPAQGEIDRSAAGYVPHDRHEALADRFFARPDESAEGWETARAAMARVRADLQVILAGHRGGDLLIVGHGGVGTLLYCHFAGLAPARAHDQPAGGGCVFAVDLASGRPLHPWRRIEAL